MSANTPPITRIDIETVESEGNYLRIRQWYEGWREGDAPNIEQSVSGRAIMYHLMDFEKQGFTCEMCDPYHGRALRGETTRIDFLKLGNEYHIRKYPYGWTAKTRPITERIVDVVDWLKASEWCEANGWTVHHWADGARAWKGEPMPVRDARSIKYLRRIANENQRNYTMDFAFDG